MVIACGRSTRQVGAMAEHLLERLKTAGQRTIGIEGKSQGDWVLVDAGDVIVHLFRPEIRSLYNLEKMWSVAPDEEESSMPAADKPARKRPARARPPRS
jgi:ribosome-associated protein